MRPVMIVLIAATAALAASTDQAKAQNRRWCTQGRSGGFPDCAYDTFKQCRASASGTGAYCVENPRWIADRKKRRK